jgi:hypothetical protein
MAARESATVSAATRMRRAGGPGAAPKRGRTDGSIIADDAAHHVDAP